MNGYKKGLIGLIISLSFVAVGMYVSQHTSVAQRAPKPSERSAAQESYVETAFPHLQGNFYMSFDRAACKNQAPSQKVGYTLVVFTSLACQICRDVHTKLFPALQASDLYKSGDLRIVFVEYPADRISFFASKYVWGAPVDLADHRRRLLMEHQSKWTGLPSEAEQLRAVEKIVGKKTFLSPEELKSVFTKKMEAQKIFDIQDVPFFVVYQHKQPKGQRIKHRIGETESKALLHWIQST